MASLRRSLGFLVPYWPTAAAAFLSMAVTALANLAAPQFLRIAIDGGIVGGGVDSLVLASAGLLAVAAFRGLFTFLQGYLSEKASQGVAYDLRNDIYGKLQSLSFSYHDQAQTGQLMTRVTSDVEMVRQFTGQGFLQLLGAIVDAHRQPPRCCFVMNWRLALVTLAIAAAHLRWSSAASSRRAQPLFTDRPGQARRAEHRPAGEPGRRAGGQGVRPRGLRGRALRRAPTRSCSTRTSRSCAPSAPPSRSPSSSPASAPCGDLVRRQPGHRRRAHPRRAGGLQHLPGLPDVPRSSCSA